MAASLAEETLVETMGEGRIAGHLAVAASLAEAAFLAEIQVTEVAVAIPMDQAAAGHRMDTGTVEDNLHAVVAVQETDGALPVLGTRGDPSAQGMALTTMTMAGVGEVVAVTVWRRS